MGDEACGSSLLDRTLHADQVTYLSGDLLPKTDRMTMAHSVEARSTFLDVQWVEWTARLPERLRVRRMVGKWLLKAAFGELLPPAICARGKQGFGMPVGHCSKTNFVTGRENACSTTRLSEWFRQTEVERLLDDHDRGKFNHGRKLWALRSTKNRERTTLLTRMQVRIFLVRPGYECLSKHLAHESKSRSVADKKVLLGNTRALECTAPEAKQLFARC
jgi:asparagine synthetase B (glutamine-hydrolysing)